MKWEDKNLQVVFLMTTSDFCRQTKDGAADCSGILKIFCRLTNLV